MSQYAKTQGGRRAAMEVGLPAQPSIDDDKILPAGQELGTENLPPEKTVVQNTPPNASAAQNKKRRRDLRSWSRLRDHFKRFSWTSPGDALPSREEHSEIIHRSDSSSNKPLDQGENVEMNAKLNEVTIAQSAIDSAHHYDTTLAVTASSMDESEEVAKRQKDGVQNRASDLSSNSNSSAISYAPPQPNIDNSHVAFCDAVNIKTGKGHSMPVMLFLDTQSTHNFVSWSFLKEYGLKARPLMTKDMCVFETVGEDFVPTHYSDLVLEYWPDGINGIQVTAKAKFYVSGTKVGGALSLLVGKSFIMDKANKIKLDKRRPMHSFKAWSKKNGKVSKSKQDTRQNKDAPQTLLMKTTEDLDRQEQFLREAEAEARTAEAVTEPSTTGSTSNPSGTSQGQQDTSSSQTDTSSVSSPNASTK